MRIVEIITEAVGGNYLYHGVSNGTIFAAILKSGVIRPSKQFDFDCEDPDNYELCPPVISMSRDKLLRFPHGNAVAQFVLDKDALVKSGFKVKPQVGAMAGRSESEERAFKPIPVKYPYVVAVQFDPELKVPKTLVNQLEQAGVRVEPWKNLAPRADIAIKPNIKPATKYTDPDKLELKRQEFGSSGPDWTIVYRTTPTSANIIQPYYMIKDEELIKRAYSAIKDRIAKGLSFDDLLPKDQYGKNWKRGSYVIPPGSKEYKQNAD